LISVDSVKDLVTALAIKMEQSFANVEKRFTDIEKSFAVLHAARAFDRVWWLLMSPRCWASWLGHSNGSEGLLQVTHPPLLSSHHR